ncbi:MAG: thioredoxin family protein [Sedimentisphaerales bacterium]|nr:thioredoxin family protein [Sedimentisphaerales bacterium]
MTHRVAAIRCVALILAAVSCTRAQDLNLPAPLELARFQQEHSSVRIQPARMDPNLGIALVFEGTEDLHYYAKPETAPDPSLKLTVKAESEDFTFGPPLYPPAHKFTDAGGDTIDVFSGDFTVFIPIVAVRAPSRTTTIEKGNVQVTISGIACTSLACLPPFQHEIDAAIDWGDKKAFKAVSLEPVEIITDPNRIHSIWLALPLAFLAGLILNLMPCVWPVLPLIVMRIVKQAKETRARSSKMGVVFCLGILLFFACLAGTNIILQAVYNTALQWGDQFRSPLFVGGMSLLLVVLALSMFGVLTLTVPSSLTGKSGSGAGYSGAIATGFLAAILSTPCGFGVLAAAFGWAQSQHWPLSTVAIMMIGLGMAAPYLILASIPALLQRLPRPGKWMELFKQSIGFVMLFIAVKLISALPETRKADVLYFAVALAFCTWMWGAWTDISTKPLKRRLVKAVAVLLAIGAAWIFLAPAPADLTDWQLYDRAVIAEARAKGKPVLIKFTADWCLSCQTAERFVFARSDIADLIQQKNVLPIKADTTEKNAPATIDLEKTYDEQAVPVSILFIPGLEQPVRMHGPFFAKQLKEALTRISTRDNRNKKGDKQ